MLKLDIGAGNAPLPDCVPVDLFVDQPDGIVATMWNIPLDDGTVDEIYSRNALEHIEKKMIVPTLKEWRRLLKHDGNLNLAVPDLVWACESWLKYPWNNWMMDIIYGNQNHEGEFHKTGFTLDLLYGYLVESGQWFVDTLDYVEGTGWIEESHEDGVYRVRATQRMIGLNARKA